MMMDLYPPWGTLHINNLGGVGVVERVLLHPFHPILNPINLKDMAHHTFFKMGNEKYSSGL